METQESTYCTTGRHNKRINNDETQAKTIKSEQISKGSDTLEGKNFENKQKKSS